MSPERHRDGKRVEYTLTIIFAVMIMANVPVISYGEVSRERMNGVIDNLILSLNDLDSVRYQKDFSQSLIAKNSIDEIGKSLRETTENFGNVLSDNRYVSNDGSRALVILQFKSNKLDMHLRLDSDAMLARDEWMDHKDDAGTVVVSETEEQTKYVSAYRAVVDSFVEAMQNNDGAALMAVSAPLEEEDGDPALYYDSQIKKLSRFAQFPNLIEFRVTSKGKVKFALVDDEGAGMEFGLALNSENKVKGIRVANYAPYESEGKTLADLGSDTLKTRSIHDITLLRDAFVADSGKMRFIALLSPT